MISRVMSDHDSGALASSSHCVMMVPRPPSSSSACRSVRLASCLDNPFSLSQLWASGKHLNNSSHPPAKPHRGRPASRHLARLLQRFSSELPPTPKASKSSSTPAIL
ncbi:hypothetical protein CRENBAI_020532 [Crenichthys baileyi]|uniref:Uncharacterized protein n=1 Tax=Crenichthys baileyi TaxID=28760 RepID=A0AAV9QY48_9TELE